MSQLSQRKCFCGAYWLHSTTSYANIGETVSCSRRCYEAAQAHQEREIEPQGVTGAQSGSYGWDVVS